MEGEPALLETLQVLGLLLQLLVEACRVLLQTIEIAAETFAYFLTGSKVDEKYYLFELFVLLKYLNLEVL